MSENSLTLNTASSAARAPSLMVALDVGSARIACAVADVSTSRAEIVALDCSESYGIRCGEVVDMARATESIRIAIAAVADRAEADVRSVVLGLSGDVKLSASKAALELCGERRCVTTADVERLSKGMPAGAPSGRRAVHRFDGPFSIGDLHGIEHPEGLSGARLDMHASCLSAPADRLDNLLKAVRAAGVEIEAVALEPMSSAMGALTSDERNLGAAVLDFGAGAFRGSLWENGRLRQIHIAAGEQSLTQSGRAIAISSTPGGGMESVTMALARRFRLAPNTASRLLRSHGALGCEALADQPASVEVAAVDGLGSVKIDTRELSLTLEELLAPLVRSLREGLTGFSNAHAGGVVLCGGGAGIRGLAPWISKRFGDAHTRLGVARWEFQEKLYVPLELRSSSACALAGLVALGAEGRAKIRKRPGTALIGRIGDGLRRLTASL